MVCLSGSDISPAFMMSQCLFIGGLQCAKQDVRCRAWSSEQDWQDLYSWGLRLTLPTSEGINFWMNSNFNVLIMLCYKISIVFFESNSPCMSNLTTFQEAQPPHTWAQGCNDVLNKGCDGAGTALATDLQWKLLGRKRSLEIRCVCDRVSLRQSIQIIKSEQNVHMIHRRYCLLLFIG